ncbi:Kip1 ubiquitination-promoting complex protein 1 [Marchantia polymorpha subsp. ruderalis]|uniref:B30.2/SPRY domain-containing protein n=2 Tax=Marchantia polymorpha TaxID=3197 RepID=A0AAF6BS45_MARPO|nr:hypothetical protein MARPO_0047s0138 [Marchantia polymorpha]BBN14829.1 hypothetical protein Mp_6g14830 [Marchantia polymorpha subsp. ruderalis]|eukprot:PTQ39174.1 hypothetical protein MARPO_0047s0138 [Marchantia polymorpha]
MPVNYAIECVLEKLLQAKRDRVLSTMTDGESSRGRRLKNLGSSGLAVVLDHEESGSVVTAATCMLDDCASGLERTLAHVLDIPSCGTSYPLTDPATDGTRIDPAAVQLYLLSRLTSLQRSDETSAGELDGVFILKGRMGPGVVMMDVDSASGNIKFDKTCLSLESQTIFSSARANACVWKGKWMFEATLGTAGIQQLGWATLSCPFTHLKGVGDAKDSYAYDGKRIRKWNEHYWEYGQLWVTGDVIGCCIDLDAGQISFYRNGTTLGVAFEGVKKLEPKDGYFPAISLSHHERCELNFGGRPFKYPVKGFCPIQSPPAVHIDRDKDGLASPARRANYLLGCLQRLVQLGSREVAAAMAPVERLKRFTPLSEGETLTVGAMIMELVQPLICTDVGSECLGDDVSPSMAEYVIWGSLVPLLMDTFRLEAPHDSPSVDHALDFLLPCLDKRGVEMVMEALAYGCRTSPFTLTDYPYTGSYAYLALACHLLERYDFMARWWSSENLESCLEGLLTRKVPNKYDYEALMPTVWWHGSREDLCSESRMRHAASALAKAIAKVEELHWELCRTLLHFIPPVPSGSVVASSTQVPGLLFGKFLRNLICKNSGANRNMPPPGLSDNSVLVSAYYVLLRFLSEGLEGHKNGDTGDAGKEQQDMCAGFLHRPEKRKFPVSLFLKENGYSYDFARLGGTFSHLSKTLPVSSEDYAEVEWEESDMDDGGTVVKHGGKCKPACCLDLASNASTHCEMKGNVEKCATRQSTSVSERSNSISSECSNRHCDDMEEDKPSSSGRVDALLSRRYSPVRKNERIGFKTIKDLSEAIREEELLDMLVLLYHLGLGSNFKQASFDMQHQMQLISQLEDIDRQIRTDKASSDCGLKKLKEDRAATREKLIECVRRCTWYRVSFFSRWKQRGMYATCMWIVQLLLVFSKRDNLFGYVPEFYVETLVDSFHALRRSDPPFVYPTSALLQQGLSPLVTFLVTHFSDSRIANPDIRDVLLQSISVLVQYKEHVAAFEKCKAARECMVGSLLAAFDNRFWIPVSNILLRLCKGAGFGASKCYPHGESFSSFFQLVQQLLKEKCLSDEKLFASFLNRLFNTLNWTITEFSVVIKEMQEFAERQCPVPELQQRKCAIMFELSCNLERILEFFTQELSHAFLLGAEMNLVRLCELIIFVLNHTTSSADAQIFDSALRQQGQSLEKINRSMILAPIVGIVLNLSVATSSTNHGLVYDLAQVIANVDYSASMINDFEYLLEFNWNAAFKGDPSLKKLPELKNFVTRLSIESDAARERATEEEMLQSDLIRDATGEDKVEICCICCVGELDTIFVPCKHQSCLRCITRHLLNNQRCFFCNAHISELGSMPVASAGEFPASNTTLIESRFPWKK